MTGTTTTTAAAAAGDDDFRRPPSPASFHSERPFGREAERYPRHAAAGHNGGSRASSLTGALTECDKSKGTWPTPKTCFASWIAIAQCAGV